MSLSYSAYQRMNADPKRSEAAKRGALTRHHREKATSEWFRRFQREQGRDPTTAERRAYYRSLP